MKLYPVQYFGNELGLSSIELAKELGITNSRVIFKIQSNEILFPESTFYRTHMIRERLGSANKPTNIVYFNVFVLKVVLLSINSSKAKDLLIQILEREERKKMLLNACGWH